MKPNHTDRHVSTSGVEHRGEFKISFEHQAHIMGILRDQIYSDKVLAVLREYSANAWDAHREVGKDTLPISVTLPTPLDPTLTIRDFGPGISDENIFDVYCSYGNSTKRGSDKSVGMLGIGSKAGFAYTDSFTVTSWYQGKQRIYTALLDNSEKGTMNMLAELDCDPSETGIQIQVPVKPDDIPEFVSKATKLFQYFVPRPDINISLPPEREPETVLQHGTVSRGHGEWIAVMGCIPYRVNLNQLRGQNIYNGGAGTHLDSLDGHLFFNIGDVQINASREELKYSDETKKRLIDKLNGLIDEFVTQTLTSIEAGDFSLWEKRCRAQVLNDLHLPIPGILKDLTATSIRLEDAKSYTITYGPKQSEVSHIHVGPKSKLIIRDEVRKIDGYGLGGYDYVIRPKEEGDKKFTIEEVTQELNEKLAKASITGIPVVLISTIPWHSMQKFSKHQKVGNPKHQVKTFVLKEDRKWYSNPWSDCWNIQKVEPSANDVYVLLHKFKVFTGNVKELDVDFYTEYRIDHGLLEELGLPIPKVYGYKIDKDAKPPANLQGTEYSTWRVKEFDRVGELPHIKVLLEHADWLKAITRVGRGYYYDNTKIHSETLKEVFTLLGPDHPVAKAFKNSMIARRVFKRLPENKKEAIKLLRERLEEQGRVDVAEKYIGELMQKYPLLNVPENKFQSLLGSFTKLWIDYIKLVDQATKGLTNAEDSVHDERRGDNAGGEGEIVRSKEGSTELPQPTEGDCRGEVGRDRGPCFGTEDCEGVVEQQVRGDGELGEIHGTGGTERVQEARAGEVEQWTEPGTSVPLLGAAPEEPLQAVG